MINYGIVEQGELTIVCEDGYERTFHAGEAIVEVVGTIHRSTTSRQASAYIVSKKSPVYANYLLKNLQILIFFCNFVGKLQMSR